MDASPQMLLLSGFLPPDDPRMRATLRAVETGLTDDRGLLVRFRPLDGVTGGIGDNEGETRRKTGRG